MSAACQRWARAVRCSVVVARRSPVCSSEAVCSSRTTWKFVPPKPIAEAAARRTGRSGSRIHGRVRVLTYSGPPVKSIALLGCSTLIVGGSVRWCRASASFIRLAVPAAPLVWPICDFTLPTAAKCRSPLASDSASVSAESSVLSPTAVPVACASNSSTDAGEQSASA